jgi:Mn-dependent DtxR family transcriptional regulator
MNKKDFHTFSEYMKKEENLLTASMEDYLEMIYRLSLGTGFTRIHDLSEALNVQPPSTTKMVQRLAELNFLKYEKYGLVVLQEDGRVMGETLLKRHNIVESFLRIFEISEEVILEETEKIEHTISDETLKRFAEYIDFWENNSDIKSLFRTFREHKNDFI